MEEKVTKCSVSKKCGSCQYQGVPYKEQPSIIEIKFMQYLTGIKKVILSVEPTKRKHIRLFR